MGTQTFIRGTFILSASSLVTRMLGFISSIFLARMLGTEGIGLLMMAQPLVPLMITLTELGLPVAISKLVAEAEVHRDDAKTKKILVVSLIVTGTLSVILTMVALLGSKFFASILLPDERAYYAMVAITPIAPIIAISAVLKGYFRGKQQMKSIAISDILEHFANIATIILLVQLLMPYGIEYAAAGAMVGAVASEAIGLLFLSIRFRLERSKLPHVLTAKEAARDSKKTLLELLRIGLPTTGHGFVHSIYGAMQPLLVTFSLMIAGVSTGVATSQFGMLAGYVLPLLFLPSFITHSLSTALIPAISEANANRDSLLMHRTMEQAMRIALIVGVPSTVILFEWATPLTTLIYQAPEAGQLLRILAPIFFLHYFDAPLHAILLGLGRAQTAMWNYIVSMIFRAWAIFVFGSQFGIQGVAWGIGVGIIVLTILNFLSVSSTIGFYLELRQSVKAGICMILMAICGQFSYMYLQHTGMSLLPSLILSVSLSLAGYFVGLVWTRTLRFSMKQGRITGPIY